MNFKICSSWLVFVLMNLAVTLSHVVLNFPPPRKYDLDYLENATSPEPCGMKKGTGKTTILSGRPFNVSWRIPYPALTGGYRLQLLDSLSRPVLDLTPVTSESDYVLLESSSENMTITIPNDYECENCTIRLVRESHEWMDKKWFWSCADVDIKSKKTYRETCSGHGRHLLSKCRCDKFFYGENCQYRDECVDNSDCGEMGRCVDLNTFSSPKKQCYCEMGWFGPNCAKRSSIRAANLDLSGHMHKELSEGFNLYWRLMVEEQEIELAIIANTTNYVAIGWRPNDTSTECRNFLKSDNTTASEMTISENEYPLHPMECTDMVIGMARGTSFRIWDYFSKDMSTPKLDTYWGGKNDLTGAYGFEKDGVTSVIFRKKIKAVELTDHSIVDEEMHVIWAKGQDTNNYTHWFDSDSENQTKSHNFYKDDELKYHGFTGNRGATVINFYDEPTSGTEHGGENGTQSEQQLISQNCMGEWKHPKGCAISKDDCEYYAQWLYLPEKDNIRFTISTNNTDLWTGIGFSNDHKMAQTDAIIGLVDKTGKAFIMDTWIVGRTSPFLDSSQDVTNVTAKITNGRTTLTFERKRSTGDSRDLAFTDDECLYMMFPVKGGKFNAVNKKIRQHKVTPSISSTRVCIRACPADGGIYGNSLISHYHLKVKLAALGKDFQLPQEGTTEYDNLSGSVTGAFQKLLSRFQKSLTIDFKGFTLEGVQVITALELHSENRYLDPAIRKTIENAVNKGQVGTIFLEPGYWYYEQIQDPKANAETDEFHRRILTTILESWIVIGCLIALLVLVLMQAWCTLCCKSSKKADQKDMMYPNMAWKDYSGAGLNYGMDNDDSDEKHPPESMKSISGSMYHPSQQKMSMPYTLQHVPKVTKPNNNVDAKSLQRPKGHLMPTDRTTQTLPRAPSQGEFENSNYYTHRPNKPQKNDKGPVQPDFYFMPSQRKYSGEVVRVYVDYENQSK